MDDIEKPEYSTSDDYAISARNGDPNWYVKSLHQLLLSIVSDNEQYFRPLNDTSIDSNMDFVGEVKRALCNYGDFPLYHIGNLWISFKVLHNIGRGTLRLRLYVYACRFHLYRIVLPKTEAIHAIMKLIESYLFFEKNQKFSKKN